MIARTSLCVTLLALLAAAPASPDVVRSSLERNVSASGLDGIVIDNIHGDVRIVTGTNEIRVRAAIEAEGGRGISAEEALAAWPVKFETHGTVLEVIVDSPHRCDDRSWGCDHHGSRHDHGRVEYDFSVEIPDGFAVEAHTVDGLLSVEGELAAFLLRNIKGPVEIAGSAEGGSASSVNGGVSARFANVPRVESKYSSINGAIDLSFPAQLDATFGIQTMNGEIFTDFDWTSVSLANQQKARRDGARWVIRDAGRMGVRIGSGRVPVRIDSLNGDITIRKAD